MRREQGNFTTGTDNDWGNDASSCQTGMDDPSDENLFRAGHTGRFEEVSSGGQHSGDLPSKKRDSKMAAHRKGTSRRVVCNAGISAWPSHSPLASRPEDPLRRGYSYYGPTGGGKWSWRSLAQVLFGSERSRIRFDSRVMEKHLLEVDRFDSGIVAMKKADS